MPFTIQTDPPRLTDSGLHAHGKQGWLILRLQRYALLGWALFFLLATTFVIYIFIDKLKPIPVLAVNEAGQLLGQFEYLSPSSRTDDELIAGVKHFHTKCLSVNATSIFDDYAACLNMMNETLRAKKLDEIKQIAYLSQIADARTRSYLVFSEKKDALKILWRDDLNAAIKATGHIVIDQAENTSTNKGSRKIKHSPFDITVEIQIVPRTRLSTQGFVVTKITDN